MYFVWYKDLPEVKFQNRYQMSTIQSLFREKTQEKELFSSYCLWHYEEVKIRVQGVQQVRHISAQQPLNLPLLSILQKIILLNIINQAKFCIPVKGSKTWYESAALQLGKLQPRATSTGQSIWVLLVLQSSSGSLPIPLLHSPYRLTVIRGFNPPCPLPWCCLGSGNESASGSNQLGSLCWVEGMIVVLFAVFITPLPVILLSFYSFSVFFFKI